MVTQVTSDDLLKGHQSKIAYGSARIAHDDWYIDLEKMSHSDAYSLVFEYFEVGSHDDLVTWPGMTWSQNFHNVVELMLENYAKLKSRLLFLWISTIYIHSHSHTLFVVVYRQPRTFQTLRQGQLMSWMHFWIHTQSAVGFQSKVILCGLHYH